MSNTNIPVRKWMTTECWRRTDAQSIQKRYPHVSKSYTNFDINSPRRCFQTQPDIHPYTSIYSQVITQQLLHTMEAKYTPKYYHTYPLYLNLLERWETIQLILMDILNYTCSRSNFLLFKYVLMSFERCNALTVMYYVALWFILCVRNQDCLKNSYIAKLA